MSAPGDHAPVPDEISQPLLQPLIRIPQLLMITLQPLLRILKPSVIRLRPLIRIF